MLKLAKLNDAKHRHKHLHNHNGHQNPRKYYGIKYKTTPAVGGVIIERTFHCSLRANGLTLGRASLLEELLRLRFGGFVFGWA